MSGGLKSLLKSGLMLWIVWLGACAYHADKGTMYQQLGEKQGITGVVDKLLVLIARDELLNKRFVDVDIPIFREHLIEQLCQVADGPCEYTGGTMSEVHRGLNISDSEFNRLVTHLREAMTQQQIPYVTQNRLLSTLAPMHSEVTYQ